MADYDINTESYVRLKDSGQGNSDQWIFETHTLFQAIGDPSGLTVIDLCCGICRLGRRLLEMGAKSVTGLDISREMLRRAEERRSALPAGQRDRIRLIEADLTNSDLALPPVDLITGLYVLHYAETPEAIGGMGRFIARNMKPDGICALVTMNPDLDPRDNLSAAQAELGIYFDFTDGPESRMRMEGFSCRVWRWPRHVLERELGKAGLCDFTWTARDVPDDRPDLKRRFAEALRHPHNVVLTARRAVG